MATKEKINVSDSMMTTSEGSVDTSFMWDVCADLNDVEEANKPNLSTIPVLKLIQSMSPEARDHRTYPDIYAGVIIDDSTKEVLGGTEEDKQLLKVYVLKSWASRIKFPPRNSGITGVECSCPTYHPRATSMQEEDWGSTYGKCSTCMYAPWGVKDGCRPQYTLLVCLASDTTRRFRIILSKTSYKEAKKFTDSWLETARPLRNKVTNQYPPYFVLPLYVYGKEEESKAKDHYYVFDLQVKPFEPGVMNKELMSKLADAKKSVEELYDESIKYHQELVSAQKERLQKHDTELDEKETVNNAFSTLEAAFGSNDSGKDYVSPGSDEDIPF